MERIKTIVALVSLSATSFKVLKQAHDFAKALDAEVVLLHVVPPQSSVLGVGTVSPTVLEEPTVKRVAAEGRDLEEMRASLAQFGVQVRTEQANVKTAEDLLLECQKLGADMLMVGTHGHGSFYNWLVGSVTAEVVAKAALPVLVVPGVDVAASVAAV